MEALPWFWIWIVLAAALCVGEMLTASFFMLPFAVGAGAAALANAVGAPLWMQFLLLVAVSITALVTLRPLANLVSKGSSEKAGAERLVGGIGVVIESGVGDISTGGSSTKGREFRVLVERDEWNATCSDNAALAVGTEIEVLRVEGAHLVVKKRPV